MKSIYPFLLFQNQQAEPALNFYEEVLPHAEIVETERFDGSGPGIEGTIKTARLRIGSIEIMVSDSPIEHHFNFTPASSYLIQCKSDEEIEQLSEKLLDGGEALMPLDDYGFSQKYTWVSDKFGVSWQLNLE